MFKCTRIIQSVNVQKRELCCKTLLFIYMPNIIINISSSLHCHSFKLKSLNNPHPSPLNAYPVNILCEILHRPLLGFHSTLSQRKTNLKIFSQFVKKILFQFPISPWHPIEFKHYILKETSLTNTIFIN